LEEVVEAKLTVAKRERGFSDAHFGHREHPDRSIMNAQIGAS
jgi:hypothetical protein